MTGVEAAVGEPRTEPRRSPSSGSTQQLVLASAALLVGAQVIFRGWALYPSWFFTDDYRLLHDARSEGMSWAYLLRPFDSQFMPFGRFVVWLVSTSHGLLTDHEAWWASKRGSGGVLKADRTYPR